MQPNQFNKNNLLLAICAVATMGLLAAINAAMAWGPTQAPPNGNPAFPAGNQGQQGPGGGQGSQGNQGPQGGAGNTGPSGTYGIAYCDWNGPFWVSHGWDGGCAFGTGALFYCDGSRIYSVQWSQNGCGIARS